MVLTLHFMTSNEALYIVEIFFYTRLYGGTTPRSTVYTTAIPAVGTSFGGT
jgi:hypothetical protein